MQKALSYIEDHLDDQIDEQALACAAQTTVYHFLRVFSMLTGMTLSEYIRLRRLTRAVSDLKSGAKVIDVALKYGYSSPDSFARAFTKFHGLPPGEVYFSSARFNSCLPLHIKLILEGGEIMDYHLESKPAMTLLGFPRHFEGIPYGEERERQEEALFVSTRAHQWILRGLSDNDYNSDIVAITNVTDSGYTFWYCSRPDDYSLNHLYDSQVTGIDFMERFGFETLEVPAGKYAVFHTPRSRHPVADYEQLRHKISAQWLPSSGYTLRNAPELAIYHWFASPQKEMRYIEIWIPVC